MGEPDVDFLHLPRVPKFTPSVPFLKTQLDKSLRKIGHGKKLEPSRTGLKLGSIRKCEVDDYFKSICHDQRKTKDMRGLALTATQDGRMDKVSFKNSFINRRADAVLRSRKFEDRNLKTDEIIHSDLYWRTVKEPDHPRHFREMENPKDTERLYFKKPTPESFVPFQEKQTFDDRYPTKSLGQVRQQRLAVEHGLTDELDRKYNPYRDQPLEAFGKHFFRVGKPKDVETIHHYFSNFLQEKGMITPTDKFIKFRGKVATLLEFDEEQVKFIEQIISIIPKNKFKIRLRELVDFTEYLNETEGKYGTLEKVGAKYTPHLRQGIVSIGSPDLKDASSFVKQKTPFYIKLKIKAIYDNLPEYLKDDPVFKEMMGAKQKLNPRIRVFDNYTAFLKPDDPVFKEMMKAKQKLNPRIRGFDNYTAFLKLDDPVFKEMMEAKQKLNPRIRVFDNYTAFLRPDDPIMKKLGAKQKKGVGKATTGEYILPYGYDLYLYMVEKATNIPQFIKLKHDINYLSTIGDKEIGEFIAEEINHDFRGYCKRHRDLVGTKIDPETLDDRVITGVKVPSGWEKTVKFKEDGFSQMGKQQDVISKRKAFGGGISGSRSRFGATYLDDGLPKEENFTPLSSQTSMFGKIRKKRETIPFSPV